uniref:Uncharacterized protein n=1 Tax=Anopheles minimus TaxID=112268 RepID=A0A182WPF3_9DIPT
MVQAENSDRVINSQTKALLTVSFTTETFIMTMHQNYVVLLWYIIMVMILIYLFVFSQ